MATYNITTGTSAAPVDYAALGARANRDIYNLNGGYLRVDTDTRYGLNGSTAANFGNIVGSASLGGTIEFNSTKVRLIAFTGGSGTVPAMDTVISQGSASGKLHGVYTALNAAPLAVAAAMPATGFIKIRQWNNVSYTAGALTGISATGAVDRAGWLEIVGQDAQTATLNRLNKFLALGDWYDFQGVTTTGARTGTYQLPTNGSGAVYCAGVEVETAVGSGVYEFYPCAGSITALLANIATDKVRGRWCWIAPTTGLVRFGSDGTNSTGGYLPVAGCKIRVANIFMTCCASAAVVNIIPNATLATRYEFATTGGGVIDMDKVSCNWYCNFAQPFSVKLTNFRTFSNITLTECASPIAWVNFGVGQEAATSNQAFTGALNFAGGTMIGGTWTRASMASSGMFVVAMSDSSGFTCTNERTHSLVKGANANTASYSFTRLTNSTWNDPVLGGGQSILTTCDTVKIKGSPIYYDHPALTTGTAIPMSAYVVSSGCVNCEFDVPQSGGLVKTQPYTSILAINAAGCKGVVLRNPLAGTYELGGDQVNATYTQATTTATATSPVPHLLKANDVVWVLISSNTGIITVGAKTVLAVPTATTFTFTCITGSTTGTLVYFPVVVGHLVTMAAGAAANGVKIQNIRGIHGRSGLMTYDNSSKNVIVENARAGGHLTHATAALNCKMKGIGVTPSFAAQTSVYGGHFLDAYVTGTPANTVAVAWTRATTTATVTSVAHGLRTGDTKVVTVSSDLAAITRGVKTITVLTADTYSFTCLNAGAATGTLTFTPANARIGLQMNEPTAETVSQVTLAGSAAFTSTGALYMPVINDQADFTSPDAIKGHTAFPITEVVMTGGTLTNHDVTYSLDGGTTYKNLSYPRAGASGVVSAFTFTVTNGSGININDYAFGTNIAPTARVTGVVGNTVTVDLANVGAVSGIVRFNQLPSEVVADALLGFPLKIRIKTTTTNALAITSLQILTTATAASQLAVYPLDTITLTIASQASLIGAEIRVYDLDGLPAGSLGTELGGTESSVFETLSIQTEASNSVWVQIMKTGYVEFGQQVTLGSTSSTFTALLVADNNT